MEPGAASGCDPEGEDRRQDLESWLSRLRAAGLPELGVALGSAHQMSTCRMAADPKLGAVKPTGETWEVAGLFVADTSTFPTATGVNPMWTCAAIAHRVAQQVKEHLAATPTLAEPMPSRNQRRRRVMGCVSDCATLPQPVSNLKRDHLRKSGVSVMSGSTDSGSDSNSINSSISSRSAP